MKIQELIEKSGYSRRTIYYYTQIGLLPPPKGKGKNYQYSEEHLRRLQKIKELQKARLSLREIQEVLDREGAEKAYQKVSTLSEQLDENWSRTKGNHASFLAAETNVRIALVPGAELLIKWPITKEAKEFLKNHFPEILEKLED